MVDCRETPEPVGDRVQRAALRMALLAFYGGGVLAISALFLPRGVFLDPVSGVWGRLPSDAAAHSRAMALGFCALFVLSFLCRMVPRATRTPLVRPRLAGAGAVLLLGAAVFDGAGGLQTQVGGLVLGACWLGAVGAWAGSLGATWRRRRAPLPWFGGWIGGGLLVLGGVGLASGVAAILGQHDTLARVASATLFGGITPIAAGLSVKMLPSMGGVGPADREAARVPTLLVAAVGGTVAAGFVLAEPFLTFLGHLGLLVVVGMALRGLGWLRLRSDGHPAAQASRQDPESRALRWSGRVAWLALMVGLATGLVAHGASTWGLEPAGLSTRSLEVLSAHLIGAGFLVTLMLGVGQRLLPGFVRSDVRWPRLRHGLLILMVGALLTRVAATVAPATMPWALHGALGLLLFAVLLFHVQVSPSIRAPDG